MTSLVLILWAAALLALSGIPGCLGARRGRTGHYTATALTLLGSLLGLGGTVRALLTPQAVLLESPWHLPCGHFAVALDPLAAVFLVPVFLIPALGAVYGLGYWKQAEHPANGRGLRLFYGLLAAAMVVVVLAADAVLFLMAWEVMAVAAFFLIITENQNPEVRRAGWIYLAATHLGTLCLMAMFILLHQASGSFALLPATFTRVGPALAPAIFVLALVGFGFKAGLMPLHVWLPGAHANAPSHVSAILSGVMLKMGIYGLLRITGLLPEPAAWWGWVLLGCGAVSAILGLAFALGQQDIKRLLAYSSVENLGIIAMGLGLALLGRALHRPDLILLGLGGALLHVWNHSLFKPLLFFNAGVILHATHTRDMEQLGGLAKRMPRTAALAMLGGGAICALPPLNGFVSEWLIYLGLFRGVVPAETGAACPATALGVMALALAGALALACFVKLLATVFLGTPRSGAGAKAHDPGASETGPMLFLALACITLGLLPQLLLPVLDRAIAAWAPGCLPAGLTLAVLAPCGWISLLGSCLALVLVAIVLGSLWLRRRLADQSVGTWSCGYAGSSPRLQYTGSSFGQTLTGLFSHALQPRTQLPAADRLFPGPAAFSCSTPDTVLDRLVLPVFRCADRYLPWLRFLQQGRIHFYLLYILIILFVLLLWK